MPFTNQYDELGDYARDLIKNKARQIFGKSGCRASDLVYIEQELAMDLIIRLPKYDPPVATAPRTRKHSVHRCRTPLPTRQNTQKSW